MKWINRCPPYDTQNFNGNDALDCVAESLCHIFFMITGIRVSPRALAVMARLDIPSNRTVVHVLSVANELGLVLWENCPTPESFTFASYYTPLTKQESQTFPVTFKLMAPDINISPLWTELAWGVQLPIPTRHMVAQVTAEDEIDESIYFDSEAGSALKLISETTTSGKGPAVVQYQTSITLTKGPKMLVFFQVKGNPTIWALMDSSWVGFSDITAFNNYVAGRPYQVLQLDQVEFAKVLANPDVFKS